MKKTRLERLNPDKGEDKRPFTREETILEGLESIGTNTCAFILEKDAGLLKNTYDVDARIGIAAISKISAFLKNRVVNEDEVLYLVIHNIDLIDMKKQTVFFTLEKDRCLRTSYDLPDDVTVVFTISEKSGCKNVLYNLWNDGFKYTNIEALL